MRAGIVDPRVLVADPAVGVHLSGPGVRFITCPERVVAIKHEVWRSAKIELIGYLRRHPSSASSERARIWLYGGLLDELHETWANAGGPVGIWEAPAVAPAEEALQRTWVSARSNAEDASRFPDALRHYRVVVLTAIRRAERGVA